MADRDYSEHEEEMLKRLEAKYSLPAENESPFYGLPVHRARVIRGTHFLSYLNPGVRQIDSAANLPEEVASPLLFYSEKNRFQGICRSLMLDWNQELDRIAELIKEAENGADHEWELQSFGLQVREDCYIYGYAGGPPLFASKDLFLSILEFVAESAAEGVPGDYRKMCSMMMEHIREIRTMLQEEPA